MVINFYENLLRVAEAMLIQNILTKFGW